MQVKEAHLAACPPSRGEAGAQLARLRAQALRGRLVRIARAPQVLQLHDHVVHACLPPKQKQDLGDVTHLSCFPAHLAAL